MKQTELTLLEQLRITEFEIENHQQLFGLNEEDGRYLHLAKPFIELHAVTLVDRFYQQQTSIPEIALLIGDADTLQHLHAVMRKYILDLFDGRYGLDYVNNRLRIGMVHKRIGVCPKLYLAAIHTMSQLLIELLQQVITEPASCLRTVQALEKLFMFDVSLVFETYIRSLVAEIESSRDRAEQYAATLEAKVRERTRQLEELSHTDPLTGLLNVRRMTEILSQTLCAAQRRYEPVSVIYIDIDDFKIVNDTYGHQHGDMVLRNVACAIAGVARMDDHCFRYGGDEFCIILPNCSEQQAHDIYIHRLCERMSESAIPVSLSIGCVQTGPEDYLPAEQLIAIADARMYACKHSQKQANS